MISVRLFLFIVLAFFFVACGGGGGSSTSFVPGPVIDGGTVTGANVLPVSVTGTRLASGAIYINKPTVSVTVCMPNNSACQTIDDILLDTGSYGLRIFRSLVTVPLSPTTAGAQTIAQCVQFADGTASWDPVADAGVVLGGEPMVQVPIQLIDAAFAIPPASCTNLHRSPADVGFNGILGVGLFTDDCGPICASSAANGIYYGCTGLSCTGTAVTAQVQNPVASLPADRNGVILRLPAVPAGGAQAVKGSLILGIGTQSNNSPSGVTAYPAGNTGDFVTTFSGASLRGFIDTGSNALFFAPPGPVLPACAAPNVGWFCPPTIVELPATNAGNGGSPSGTLSFPVGNFASSFGSGNTVFSDIAGGNASIGFDWGLPFFFGRDVYVGIEGTTSTMGTGPYWAI